MEVRKRKRDWALSGEAFDGLLRVLDDSDRERAGEKYEQLRRKLLEFFEARGSRSPSDDADETINRVARKISEGEEVHDILRYFYGVARLVLMELFRGRDKETVTLDVISPSLAAVEVDEETVERRAEQELHLECFETCLSSLPVNNREFIIEYYREDKGVKIARRKRQAEAMGIPLNALRLRAFRIRARLDECLDECLRQATAK